ncbi:hypothetical protein, conserved [Plasmodium gonderi]|uniref:WW domain-containing protein n=1 Tax=Plasmodium gonderi TaxID=77519 RepID=A0A1Y1JKC0_PLAGO|nr:hypothetical protein, conserved [Plasmodium gonderi]GAW80883.1 hypothetical protein, conserved [Plasmodium gonderi]
MMDVMSDDVGVDSGKGENQMNEEVPHVDVKKAKVDEVIPHVDAEIACTGKYDHLSREMQEYYVGVPYSWEYVEDSKGWFVIETSKNYKFYFNKKTNEKTWKCPKEVEILMKKKQGKRAINKSGEKNDNCHFSDEQHCNGYGTTNDYAIGDNKSCGITNSKWRNSYGKIDMEKILREYKDLLIEKNMDKFCKYDNVLAHILYDQRYLNVPKELRKEYFHKIIKEIDEDKKRELKMLIENFQNLLSKVGDEIVYPFNESDAISLLKGKEGFEGNHTKNWNFTRNKLLKEFLEKKKKDMEKEMEQNFEIVLNNHLKEASPGGWIKIKNNLGKNKKYEILSYDKKNQIFQSVSQKLLEKRKNKCSPNDQELYPQRSRGSRTWEHDEKTSVRHSKDGRVSGKERANMDERNLFLSLLHEKLKKPTMDENILKYDTFPMKKYSNFEDAFKIPTDLTKDERYKNIRLSDMEKFDLYKKFINSYINSKRDMFEKLLHEVPINYVNKSIHDIIKLVDKEDRIFTSIKLEHLEMVFSKWKNYKIREAKKMFTDYLKKSNFVKYNSDERDNYERLLGVLSQDLSYELLKCVPMERESIIKERIKELKAEHEKNKNLAEKLNR